MRVSKGKECEPLRYRGSEPYGKANSRNLQFVSAINIQADRKRYGGQCSISTGVAAREVKMKRVDLTGKRFGRLLVIAREGSAADRGSTWKCRCNKEWGGCGRYKIIRAGALTRGATRSCGCMRRGRRPAVNDLTGQTFGRLRVLKRSERGGVDIFWDCVCDSALGGCDRGAVASGSSLRAGDAKSCGCFHANRVLRATIRGLDLTAKRIAELSKLSIATISYRIKKGVTGDALLSPPYRASGAGQASAPCYHDVNADQSDRRR